MSRPRRSPTTAVTNSAVDSRWTARNSHVAGTTVRYGRIAKPTTSQATSQAINQMPPLGVTSIPPLGVGTSRPAGLASARPTKPPSATPSSRMFRITVPSDLPPAWPVEHDAVPEAARPSA